MVSAYVIIFYFILFYFIFFFFGGGVLSIMISIEFMIKKISVFQNNFYGLCSVLYS